MELEEFNITAEDLFEKMNPQDGKCPEWAKEFAIKFAQIKVEEALIAAQNSVDAENCFRYSSEHNVCDNVEEAIVKSYPLEKIK